MYQIYQLTLKVSQKLSTALLVFVVLATSARADLSTMPSAETINSMYVEGYEPTVLHDVAEADRLFRTLRGRKEFFSKIPFLSWSGAQCYHRAHVWSYEMAQAGIRSQKVVLWYSNWYYNWYRENMTTFKLSAWVFHIAPVVLVGENKEHYVLDRGFDSIQGPLKLQDWARVFLDGPYKNMSCKIIYSAHEYLQERDNKNYPCLLQVVPMYYFSPMLFDDLEDQGTVIRSFIQRDVDASFRMLRSSSR